MTRPDPIEGQRNTEETNSEELRDWCDALDAILRFGGPTKGPERAAALLDALVDHARRRKLDWRPKPITLYPPQGVTMATPVAAPVRQKGQGACFEAQGRPLSTMMAFECHIEAMRQDPDLSSRIVHFWIEEPRTSGAVRSERVSDSGGLSSWVVAATSHSSHGRAMLPFLVFQTLSGFQHVGDLIWTASHHHARGFLIGTTPGPATQKGREPPDVSSHLIASTVPNCRAYDPAFAAELAVILDHGSRQMLAAQCDHFYYVTVSDEVTQSLALRAEVHAGVMRGMYLLRTGPDLAHRVQLLGSGAAMGEVLKAAALLERDHGIAADVWSVTSYVELAREGTEQERLWRHGVKPTVDCWFGQNIAASQGPIIATTDYVRALPELVRAFVPPGRRYISLGTDGLGRGDPGSTRRQNFEIDAQAIVRASLRAIGEILAEQMDVERRGFKEVTALASI
jgi:pyruvate dehydrogenase E1 component